MNNLIVRTLMAAGVASSLALGGVALAEGSKPAPKPAHAAAPATAKGTIVSVDASANTLTVKEGAADKTYKLAPAAKVSRGKKTIKLGDLKAGDKVSVGVDQKDASVASSVKAD